MQDCLKRLDNSFSYPQADKQDQFKKSGYIYLPKIGYVKLNAHFRVDPSLVSRINVKFHGGKWYVNLTSEIDEAQYFESLSQIGIDVGLLSFAALPDGTRIENPRNYRKSEQRLAKLQMRLSRKKKGSKN